MQSVWAFLREYADGLLFALFILLGLTSLLAQAAYSRYVKAQYGEDIPRVTINNRTEGLVIAFRIVFSHEPKAPLSFKLILAFYRLLWLVFVVATIFFIANWP